MLSALLRALMRVVRVAPCCPTRATQHVTTVSRAKTHGTEACYAVSWRDGPSGIWAYVVISSRNNWYHGLPEVTVNMYPLLIVPRTYILHLSAVFFAIWVQFFMFCRISPAVMFFFNLISRCFLWACYWQLLCYLVAKLYCKFNCIIIFLFTYLLIYLLIFCLVYEFLHCPCQCWFSFTNTDTCA